MNFSLENKLIEVLMARQRLDNLIQLSRASVYLLVGDRSLSMVIGDIGTIGQR